MDSSFSSRFQRTLKVDKQIVTKMNHLDDLHSHIMGAGERSDGGREDRG